MVGYKQIEVVFISNYLLFCLILLAHHFENYPNKLNFDFNDFIFQDCTG